MERSPWRPILGICATLTCVLGIRTVYFTENNKLHDTQVPAFSDRKRLREQLGRLHMSSDEILQLEEIVLVKVIES